MPSYKTSTLSLMVLEYFRSLKYLIVIVIAVAYFSPETYTAISQEKTLVLVAFWSYTALWIGLYSAYLQRNQTSVQNVPDQVSNQNDFEQKTWTISVMDMTHDEFMEAKKKDDLHNNQDLPNVG